ncbi:MAG: hypothetical protein JWO12_1993 [Frankiales bacterium]|nr:hypothetical protein [Frankiales bacterium]
MQLLWRALRWRAAASVATALLSAVTVLGAVLGPLWTRAGSESVLRDTLTEAGPEQNAAFGEVLGLPTRSALADLTDLMTQQDLPFHGPVIQGLKLISDMRVPGSFTPYRSALLYRQGFCQQVTLVSGRCPERAGEVLVHRTASTRMALGGELHIDATVKGERGSNPDVPLQETVVGVYLPKDQSSLYWTGEGETAFLSYGASEFGLAPIPERVPATLTVPETFERAAADVTAGDRVLGYATATRLADVSSVRLKDVPVLRDKVRAAQARVALHTSNASMYALRDNLTDQFDKAQLQGRSLGRASTVVLAQLVLLAGVVLLLVVGGSATARAPEVAAARLRGLRTRTVVGLAVAEPLVLVAAGAPVGGLLALVTVKVMAAVKLVPGTPVALPSSALLTLLVAAGALLLAVLLVCARELGKPVLELWQRTSKAPSRGALGLDGLLVAAGVGAALGCLNGPQPWVLLTPVPVSLVIALVGLRLLPVVCVPALRRTRGRRRMARFLAVRQLVRRREGALLAGLLVVAFGLAATATTAWSVANRAAVVRGDTEVGAGQVLYVGADAKHPGLDLREVVRSVDPTGTKAMAVLEYLPFSGEPGGRFLAVDSPRLSAVARWDESVVGMPVSQAQRILATPKAQFATALVTDKVSVDPLAVLASNTPRDGAVVTSVDGFQHAVLIGGTVRSLPRALSSGTIVDWSAIAYLPPSSLVALPEVWMTGPDKPLQKRLTDRGLMVLSTDVADRHRELLARSGPALAVLLSLVAAGLALVLAVATTLFSVLTSARRRGWELAALGAMGVPARTLRRASRGESLLLLVVGLSLGVAAGATACAVTLPHLPLFAGEGEDVTVPLTPGPVAVIVLLLVAVGLALGTSFLVGRVLQQAADPSRLREVQA